MAAAKPIRHTVSSNDMIINPFKGAKSYEEQDSFNFYGRSDEIAKLFQLIRLNILTVFYSQSGIGKSSLLRAGLMPTLRYNDYLPIYIRPNYGDHDLDLKDFIVNQITFSIDKMKAASDNSEFGYSYSRPFEDESLFEYFHRNPFYKYIPIEGDPTKAAKSNLIPVLIFDQFEEIFTIGGTNQRLYSFFKDELSDLIENNLPAKLRNKTDDDQNQEDNEIKVIEYTTSVPNYKVIFSLREEFLSNLEGISKDIPSVFYTSSRFRLMPFSRQTAQEVILKISDYVFEPAIAVNVINLISDDQSANEGSKRKKDAVEPFLLSLVCFHLFPKLLEKDAQTIIDLQNRNYQIVDKILNNYYEESLRDMPIEVRVFVEEELLTDKGNRTLHNNEDAEKRVGKEFIDKLVDEFRLLRKEEFLDSQHLEIIHDRITPIIIQSRSKRRADEKEIELEKEKLKQAEESQRLTEKKLLETEKIRAEEFEVKVRDLEEVLRKQNHQELLEEKEKNIIELNGKFNAEKAELTKDFERKIDNLTQTYTERFNKQEENRAQEVEIKTAEVRHRYEEENYDLKRQLTDTREKLDYVKSDAEIYNRKMIDETNSLKVRLRERSLFFYAATVVLIFCITGLIYFYNSSTKTQQLLTAKNMQQAVKIDSIRSLTTGSPYKQVDSLNKLIRDLSLRNNSILSSLQAMEVRNNNLANQTKSTVKPSGVPVSAVTDSVQNVIDFMYNLSVTPSRTLISYFESDTAKVSNSLYALQKLISNSKSTTSQDNLNLLSFDIQQLTTDLRTANKNTVNSLSTYIMLEQNINLLKARLNQLKKNIKLKYESK